MNKLYFQIKAIKASRVHKKGVKITHLSIKKVLLTKKVKLFNMVRM
jgi:hypothetical protein